MLPSTCKKSITRSIELLKQGKPHESGGRKVIGLPGESPRTAGLPEVASPAARPASGSFFAVLFKNL